MFVITPIDPSEPGSLPHTEADDLALSLPEPTSARNPNLRSWSSSRTSGPSSSKAQNDYSGFEGIEDSDYELQAALQASLMGASDMDPDPPLAPPPMIRTHVPLPLSGSEPSSALDSPHPVRSLPALTELDPVAASMARNRLMLQRARAEQEHAQRELWESRRAEGGEEDDEDEMLRRAIIESEELAKTEGHASLEGKGEEDDSGGVAQSEPGYPPTHPGRDRVYDDDDAELQVRLKILMWLDWFR